MACRLIISVSTILQVLHKASCNFIFIGCFEDTHSFRILPYYPIVSTSMTTTKCINHCKSKSFKYAGTQYGQECHCGHGTRITCASWKPTDECNFKCTGNKSEFCGSVYKMHVYTKDVPVASIPICNRSVSTTEELTSSWPMTPTAKQQVSPRMFCSCKCNVLDNRSTLTNAELKKRILDVKKKLKLNKSSTSRFIRRKVSAGDDRQTAAGVGVLGIAMLSIVLVPIVLSDIIKFIAYIKSC